MSDKAKKTEGKGGKVFVITALALLLALTVYASYRVNSKDAAAEGDEVQAADTLDQGAQAEEPAEPGEANYFEAFRQDRNDVRALELEYLDEIIAASAPGDETLAEAQQQKLALVDNMEKEFIIESMIKAKGFSDAAVTFQAGSVNVVVDAPALSNEQAAQILDIVRRETGEAAGNIKIVANG